MTHKDLVEAVLSLRNQRRDLSKLCDFLQQQRSAPPVAPSVGELEWRTDESYWGGEGAEYAWAAGTRDLHWMALGGQLALFDNEYDRVTTIQYKEGRSQEETKALANSLQRILSGAAE